MLAAPRTATVLVVEDDRNLRELYRSALVASRYHVSVAADGLAALTTIERTRPDVVVLDLGLPGVNGWDVYRDLRAQKETETLPIIIVTGHALRDIDGVTSRAFLKSPWILSSWSRRWMMRCIRSGHSRRSSLGSSPCECPCLAQIE